MILCNNKTVLGGLNLLVLVSNLVLMPLKIIGIISVSYQFKKAGIEHP